MRHISVAAFVIRPTLQVQHGEHRSPVACRAGADDDSEGNNDASTTTPGGNAQIGRSGLRWDRRVARREGRPRDNVFPQLSRTEATGQPGNFSDQRWFFISGCLAPGFLFTVKKMKVNDQRHRLLKLPGISTDATEETHGTQPQRRESSIPPSKVNPSQKQYYAR